MKLKSTLLSSLLIITFTLFILGLGYVHAQNTAFPSYGSGAVQVRMYTDYFCPPCRGMEPGLEPVLRNLLKINMITLTLVDTPFSHHSALFARYFLYALNAKNNFEHALMVRNTLFEATVNKYITTEERLDELFRSKRIPFTSFDPKPIFDRFSAFFTEDKINSTPSCVIVKDGKMETLVGGANIINALKGLQ